MAAAQVATPPTTMRLPKKRQRTSIGNRLGGKVALLLVALSSSSTMTTTSGFVPMSFGSTTRFDTDSNSDWPRKARSRTRTRTRPRSNRWGQRETDGDNVGVGISLRLGSNERTSVSARSKHLLSATLADGIDDTIVIPTLPRNKESGNDYDSNHDRDYDRTHNSGINGSQEEKTEDEEDLKQTLEDIRDKLLEVTNKLSDTTSRRKDGLSKFHRSIVDRSYGRQRFVTGRHPLFVSVTENPTRKWLANAGTGTSQLLLNGTAVDNSLASFDRFQWLDDSERDELADRFSMVSMELIGEISIKKPGYINVMPTNGAGVSASLRRTVSESKGWERWKSSALYERLVYDFLGEQEDASPGERVWVTGFSLASPKGFLNSIDTETGQFAEVNARTARSILWPNEANAVPANLLGVNVRRRHATKDDSKDSKVSTTPTTSVATPENTSSWQQRNRRSDALLVSDGFLVPGKDRGGLYVIKKPGDPDLEWTVPLTSSDDNWFYHRAVWVDLTGDGRKSVLTARARAPSPTTGTSGGQLVWLETPQPFSYDKATGTPLEEDGTEFDPFDTRHIPWKTRVLAEGPDVMFSVADLDENDDTIEIVSGQFFKRRVVLHSIQRGSTPSVVLERTLDDQCGAAFGVILADLDGMPPEQHQQQEQQRQQQYQDPRPAVIDSGSTIPALTPGASFSHVLVTSHECSRASSSSSSSSSPTTTTSFGSQRNVVVDGVRSTGHVEENKRSSTHSSDHKNKQQHFDDDGETDTEDGGSLFAYRVPQGKDAWKTEPWVRTTVASGFRVKGQLGNMINPGAPGFVYTFQPTKERQQQSEQRQQQDGKSVAETGPNPTPANTVSTRRPLIAVAGDCAESAYFFRPVDTSSEWKGDGDPAAQYKLMCEIACGATVGSIGVGYEDFMHAEQEQGFAKIYLPCYEKDKILVFAMGSGEDADADW